MVKSRATENLKYDYNKGKEMEYTENGKTGEW